MSTTRLAPLALAVLTACFVDVGSNTAGPDGASSTTSSGTTTTGSTGGTSQADATGPDAPTTSSASTTQDQPTTRDGSSDTTATTTTTTTTTMMTPSPTCGDGTLDDGEQCDDGNLDNGDDCTADCTAASCSDGFVNQDETGVDCGGLCGPCGPSGPCGPCDSDDDCDEFLSCDGTLCTENHLVLFDWSTNCGLDSTDFVKVPTYHMGQWRVEAVGGGGQREKLGSYGWLAECEGFAIGSLFVPFEYPSPEDAFNALDPKSVVVFYDGGPTACGIIDAVCDNNNGSSQLRLSLACD